MRNLILHHLEAIIESGSVIGACRRLFLSQPALSQYIKRLEAEYGIVIFDRSVSPWKLTEEGEHLLETQRKIQQLDEECRQFFRSKRFKERDCQNRFDSISHGHNIESDTLCV